MELHLNKTTSVDTKLDKLFGAKDFNKQTFTKVKTQQHLTTINEDLTYTGTTPRSAKRPQSSSKFAKTQQIQDKEKERNKERDKHRNEGRDEKVDSDLYYHYKDENEKLKLHQYKLNDEIKRLQVMFEKVKHGVILERGLSDRRVIKTEGNFDIEVEELKLENDKLKDKVKKMTTVIQGLNSEKSTKYYGPKKNLIHANTQLVGQSEKNEYHRLISLLREQLKRSEAECNNLHKQLNDPNYTSKRLSGDYTKELKDKSIKVQELQHNYEKLLAESDTQRKITEHTKVLLEEKISQLNTEKTKTYEMEKRIQIQEAQLTKIPEFIKQNEEYKQIIRDLEEKLKDLCESPFIKEAEQRGNVFKKMQESELSNSELKRKLTSFEDSNKNLIVENKNFKDNLEKITKERDLLKEEVMRYRISSEEKEKNTRLFDEQLKLLGQYGEVDSTFSKFLSLMKAKDDSAKWTKIDFLEKMGPDNLSPEVLAKEVERLKIEKGVLGTELEKTKSLLLIQQQINEDQQKMFDLDTKILKNKLEKAITKIEELCKLVDIERLPKDKTAQQFYNTNAELIKKGLMTDDLKDFKDFKDISKGMANIDRIPDNITEFSVTEADTEFGMNENALDIWLGQAFLEKGLEKELGFPISSLMSFLAVDFYLHDTQTSNLNNGLNPTYNLQLTFKVNVDEHFLHYLESDYLKIDMYYISNNIQFLLGYARISLNQLLENEENLKNDLINTHMSKLEGKLTSGTVSRVIHNVASIFYVKEPTISIGKVHYKMRMRHPILEAIKWYREKDKVLRDISPMHDLFSKKMEKDIKTYGGTGKTMQVTIMISKATGLKVHGPPRKISPYLYYQFYKFDDHYSETGHGENPQYGLVDKYNVVYDQVFNDYVENQYLEVVVLDDSSALEVQIQPEVNNTGSVNLIENKDSDDLIGVAKVSLKELTIRDLVQGSYPIMNRKNQIAGELFVNIFWEEVIVGDLDKDEQHPFENRAWEKILVRKLADLIKHKGMNLNSAFNLLDKDNKGSITIDNFKNFVQFSIGFTDKQRELEELVECVFNKRKKLSKRDFYTIFAYLLPHDGPIENLLESHDDLKFTNQSFVRKLKDNNKIDHSVSLSFTSDKKDEVKPRLRYSNNEIVNLKKPLEKAETMKTSQERPKEKDFHHSVTFENESNRTYQEIVEKIDEYMRKNNKREIVLLFKMFDKDANNIDMKEMVFGFNKIGVPLSNLEADKVWREITENKKVEKIDFQMFKRFYENYTKKNAQVSYTSSSFVEKSRR